MAFSYSSYKESDAVKKKRQQAEANSVYKESAAVTNLRNQMNQYSKYVASDAVNQAKNEWDQHSANKIADWTGGTYGQTLKDQINKINNREKFSYDLNGDVLYQQYKDQYINKGRLAMADTMGQAAAMTGGYGNSYASTAGNQAYQGYLQQLNDVVPELYQLALNKYSMEGDELYNQLNMYQNAYDTEYGEYRDKVSDWYNEDSRLSQKYYNEANMDYDRFSSDRDYYTTAYNNERTFDYDKFTANRDYYTNLYNNERTYDYGLYDDAYNRAFAAYQQKVSEDQFAKNLAFEKAQFEWQKKQAKKASGGGGSSGSKKSSSKGKTSVDSSSSKNRYANWDAGQWQSYFAQIRNSSGTAAAQQQLNNFIKNKYIPTNMVSYASLGARGKFGH